MMRKIVTTSGGVLAVFPVNYKLVVVTRALCSILRSCGSRPIIKCCGKNNEVLFFNKENGILLNKHQFNKNIYDASLYGSKLAISAISEHASYIYIIDVEKGYKKSMYISNSFVKSVTLLEDGFLAGFTLLGYFDLNGKRKWKIDLRRFKLNRPNDFIVFNIETSTSPAVAEGYAFVALHEDTLLEGSPNNALLVVRLSDGKVIELKRYDELIIRTATCGNGNYLAVGGKHHIYIYKIHKAAGDRIDLVFENLIPTKEDLITYIYHYFAKRLQFSPDCKYLAYTVFGEKEVNIVNIKTGKHVLKIKTGDHYPSALYWDRNKLYVGMCDGDVYEITLTLPISSKKKFMFEEQIEASQNVQIVD